MRGPTGLGGNNTPKQSREKGAQPSGSKTAPPPVVYPKPLPTPVQNWLLGREAPTQPQKLSRTHRTLSLLGSAATAKRPHWVQSVSFSGGDAAPSSAPGWHEDGGDRQVWRGSLVLEGQERVQGILPSASRPPRTAWSGIWCGKQRMGLQ